MKSAKNIVADIVGIMAMDIAQIVLLIKSEQRGERRVLTMDDLISRQAVIDLLKKNTTRDIEEVVVTEKNIKLIMDMQKAYDVDAVIEQLEKAKKKNFESYKEATDTLDIICYGNVVNAYGDAISVVKAGGING